MMKRKFSSTRMMALLALLLAVTACNGPVPQELPKEQEPPKLVKTIGDPNYGNVNCILEDRDGHLWFGTTENGLYEYDGKSFVRFLMGDGLNSNEVYSLLEDQTGKIWIGTGVGLCLYDPSAPRGPEGKRFTEIKIPLPENLPPNKNERYRNSHWVFSMMQAKDGKIWLATIDGVFVYDGKTFTPFVVDAAAEGFLNTNTNVERIFEDRAGNIWFGARTYDGVYRYDGKSVTNFPLEDLIQDGPTPKPHHWGWPQVQDRNGNIWFGNWGGAYRYDGTTFSSFSKKDGLAGGVTKIIEDKDGNIWLGGDAGAGLSRYDGRTFKRFTTQDGLINNSIWAILEDRAGNLWVGTRGTGLSRFDGERFVTYSEYRKEP